MNARVAFVSIFDLTRLFYEIASRMEREGHTTYWITTNQAWTAWLESKGVPRANILELVYSRQNFVSSMERERLIHKIMETESTGDLTINQALLMDQFVMSKNNPDINEYMLLYYRDLKRFLLDKQITQVFAEPTNSNEVVMSMICRQLNVSFLSIRDMRIPLGRIIFNQGHLQSRVTSGPSDRPTIAGHEVIASFTKQKTTPSYFAQNSRSRAVDPKNVLTAVNNRISRSRFTNTHLTHHSLSGRVKLAMKRLSNGIYMRRICRYDSLADIAGRICYYGLHVQPEASIDVLGSYFSDQVKLIKDIRRALPFDTTLVVKEHPNFLGIKPIGMFRQIRRLPNVKLVRHDTSSFDLYKRASVVVTVSGTTAYEAGLLGIPAIVLSPMYFDGLSTVRHCPDITQLKSMVERLLADPPRDYEADCRFMDKLMARSYPGRWGNPLTNPDLFDEQNLENLTRACLDVLEPAHKQITRWLEEETSIGL